jgi:predicted transcriptional regulator
MAKSDEQLIIQWLQTHDLIKHSTLERQCGMPQGCLYKIINGSIEFPIHHIPALLNALKPYGVNILNLRHESTLASKVNK